MPSVEPGLVRCCPSDRHGVRRGNLAGRTAAVSDLRQPEIQNLGMTAFGDKDVCRLDVTMDDTSGMRGIEGIGDFDGERENQFRFQRTPRNAMLQRHPIQELHCNERLPLVFPNLVDGTDVGMV